MFTTGTTPGRDTPEIVTQHTSAAAGGRTQQPEGTAGGRRRSQEKCREAASNSTGSGKKKNTQTCPSDRVQTVLLRLRYLQTFTSGCVGSRGCKMVRCEFNGLKKISKTTDCNNFLLTVICLLSWIIHVYQSAVHL